MAVTRTTQGTTSGTKKKKRAPGTQGPVKITATPALKTATKKAVRKINTATGESTTKFTPKRKTAEIKVKPITGRQAKRASKWTQGGYRPDGLALTGTPRSRAALKARQGRSEIVQVDKKVRPARKAHVAAHEIGHALGLSDRYDAPAKSGSWGKKTMMGWGEEVTKAGTARIKRTAGVGRVPTKRVKAKKSK